MRRKNLAIAILLSAAVALTGCTSGGTATPPPQLVPAAGLQAGAAEPPVYAKDRTDTLSKLLPVAANVFAPLSAALRRDYEGEGDGSGSPNTKLKDDFHIESIASDGADGFRVTYVHEEKEPVDVHFTKERYGTAESGNGESYSLPFTDGGWEYIRLWDYSGSFDDGPSNQGSGRYRYFDVLGFKYRDPELRDEGFVVEDRVYMVFGARTETLPAGSAFYNGRMYLDIYDVDNPLESGNLNILGDVSLKVDFGEGALNGMVTGLRQRPFGSDNFSNMSDTNSIEITGAEILDGRFTAKLEGKDSDENAVMDEQSVLGYVGDILGEFYGPDAEEVGGVLNGSRDADGDGSPDTVMHGYIGGSLFPHLISDSPWRVLSTAVKRDRPGAAQDPDDYSGTVALSTAEVTSVASDAAGGFTLAYTVDGVEKTVALEAGDLGKHPTARATHYYDITGDTTFILWDQSGGLRGSPQYEYFDINGWGAGAYADNGEWTAFDRGFVIYGNQTEAMPSSGIATYAGRMRADRWRADRPRSSISGSRGYRGDLTLTANFADATISGGVSQIVDTNNQNAPLPAVTFTNGRIQNSSLSADFSGLGGFTGKVEGAFFGPSAEEVGGVLEGTHTGGDLLVGYIGGKKQ